MYIHMYVHACMYTYIHILYIHVMYVHNTLIFYAFMHVCMHNVRTYVRMHVCRMYAHMYACTYVGMYIYTYA